MSVNAYLEPMKRVVREVASKSHGFYTKQSLKEWMARQSGLMPHEEWINLTANGYVVEYFGAVCLTPKAAALLVPECTTPSPSFWDKVRTRVGSIIAARNKIHHQ